MWLRSGFFLEPAAASGLKPHRHFPRLMQRSIIRSDRRTRQQDGRGSKRHGGHPGPKPVQEYRVQSRKHPDTRMTATGSDDDSRDSVHDRCLCIAA